MWVMLGGGLRLNFFSTFLRDDFADLSLLTGADNLPVVGTQFVIDDGSGISADELLNKPGDTLACERPRLFFLRQGIANCTLDDRRDTFGGRSRGRRSISGPIYGHPCLSRPAPAFFTFRNRQVFNGRGFLVGSGGRLREDFTHAN